MNKSKGFTIIELIVVIAIIAVLASIVLVNVTQYIAKGKDSSIKGNLATILTNGAIWYDGHASVFTGFDADATYTNPATAISNANGSVAPTITFSTAVDAFCACSPLNIKVGTDSQYYCVDSTGKKKQVATACATECVLGVCQ